MNKKPENLYEIIRILRAPGGCPWDREQTSESVSSCMAEECAEVLEAIDLKDPELLCEELGDLWMNVIFQAVIAEEKGDFTWEDVQKGICEKMIRRHAHVFGDLSAESSTDVLKIWDKIKAGEKKKNKSDSVMGSIPPALSALNTAEKIQKKAAKYDFDWSNQNDIISKIKEELTEVEQAMAQNDDDSVNEELGDLLFAVVNLIRFRKQKTSEQLLRAANSKFVKRFQYIESELKKQNRSLEEATLDEMEKLYQEAKKC
ncbi:MAG: nucleoside triphosphate pyrophosphohydrolase [Lentisphaeria bacterium]|nr:nucleoside triphosphate pyrophosphohydrolase [Lentisphaeria bacterium]